MLVKWTVRPLGQETRQPEWRTKLVGHPRLLGSAGAWAGRKAYTLAEFPKIGSQPAVGDAVVHW